MIKVLLDTNIILDLALGREDFVETTKDAFRTIHNKGTTANFVEDLTEKHT